MQGYYESLRYELYHKKIRVTILCPSATRTELLEQVWKGKEDVLNRMRPMAVERAAHLFVVALANQISEAWIATQPTLTLFYAAQYMPSVFRVLFQRAMTAERLAEVMPNSPK